MNRQIKFRAWDTVEKKMRLEALEIKDIGVGEGSVVASEDVVQTDHPLKWMQFTGLKDKNGKEIYEGDMVAHCWHEAEEQHESCPALRSPWSIGFLNGAFCFQRDSAPNMYFNQITDEQLEIIGNIFENPELLN